VRGFAQGFPQGFRRGSAGGVEPDPHHGRSERSLLGLANGLNRVKLHRRFLDQVLGVHPEAHPPEWASTSFAAWAEKSGRMLNRLDQNFKPRGGKGFR